MKNTEITKMLTLQNGCISEEQIERISDFIDHHCYAQLAANWYFCKNYKGKEIEMTEDFRERMKLYLMTNVPFIPEGGDKRIETDVTYILQNFDTVKFLRFGMFYDDSTLFTAYAKDGSYFVFRPGYKANKFFISKVFSRN
jgi:hypothetical protein